MKPYRACTSVGFILTACIAWADEPARSNDASVFGAGVRPTPWLSPAEELDSFHLHPEFEIRLFAAEPNIAKPLNIAPDEAGQIWVTCTVEYPYPAKTDRAAKDFIMVLKDTDEDGAADQFIKFADGLNIPMGVLPYGDGCLCFSIPNLVYLRDTDGDGICDRREVVLGPFDTTRDTHGMINALRDGGDGWIYACHGFNNQSEVAGRDGHVVRMVSGNTFRFRLDGSRVELFTRGQVNPFGMTIDEWGYHYTADCHSKPITQLIHGGCYPSFGRPHDGLGFLPSMMEHLHSSTAISGIQFIPPQSSIKPLRGQFLSGNVMTSRINRNRRQFFGATAKAIAMDDFLSSEDPWFRPVDIRLSADGFFYVADFYNKIIGHYEVPLDHPERDRTSGRIWQIRYVPNKTSEANPATPHDQFSKAEALIQSPSQTTGGKNINRGNLAEAELFSAAQSKLAPIRVKAFRLIPQLAEVSSRLRKLTRQSLGDPNPHVQRAAAENLGQYGDDRDLFALMDLLSQLDESDPVLRQTIRIAVRSILQRTPASADIWLAEVDAEMASIMLGLPNRHAAATILRYLNQNPDAENRDSLLTHAVKHADVALLQQAVELARASTSKDVNQAFLMLDAMCSVRNIGTGNVPAPLLGWANELVRSSLLAIDPNQRVIAWSASQLDSQTHGNWQPQGDWPSESRKTSDAGEQSLTSSFGRGESYVGRLISNPFLAPKTIRFNLAGHNGFPDQPDHGKNRIQLVSQSTGELLAEATPPRNDRAVVVTWNIQQHEGKWVRIECIDDDSADAYAWIAFGNFQPGWLHPSDSVVSLRRSLLWIDRLKLGDSSALLESMVANSNFSAALRAEVLSTIASLGGNQAAVTVLASLLATGSPVASIEQAIETFRAEDTDAWNEVIKQLCKRFTASDQREFCSRWLRSGASIDDLLGLVKAGWISSRALIDPDIEQLLEPRLNPNQQMRINELTQGLEENLALVTRLKELQQQVRGENGNADRGRQLYTQHCATCHQLRGQGAVVGPQLDGTATRSVTRLLEDIVTPDRNVDRAFRTTSLLLEDGRVLVGLVTDETDQEITLVESSGKPFKIHRSVIEVRKEAGRSLMPANLGQVLTATDFEDLLNYLRR